MVADLAFTALMSACLAAGLDFSSPAVGAVSILGTVVTLVMTRLAAEGSGDL